MKEELRPCVVKIGEETETISNCIGDSSTNVIKEAETFEGYFHKWIDENYSCGDYSTIKTYGLVEFKDGTAHKVDPECITFTDRDCKD